MSLCTDNDQTQDGFNDRTSVDVDLSPVDMTLCCSAVALWRCGAVALWRCGAVALWRCDVALWRCGAVARTSDFRTLVRILGCDVKHWALY